MMLRNWNWNKLSFDLFLGEAMLENPTHVATIVSSTSKALARTDWILFRYIRAVEKLNCLERISTVLTYRQGKPRFLGAPKKH